MSAIFHSTDIYPHIKKELIAVETELLIVSAFVKLNALKQIDADLNNSLKVCKRLLVRFRKEDILHGSTDLNLFYYCLLNNWELYIDFDLHSKIFIFDKKRFCIGSANVTLSGLGLIEQSNIETVCHGDLGWEDYQGIADFFQNATLLDATLFDKMLFECKNAEVSSTKTPLKWSKELMDLVVSIPNKLWVSDLPSSSSPYDMNSADRALLGVNLDESTDLSLVRNRFKGLKCYAWLSNAFDKETYYGRLSAELHAALVDNPNLYRKDIKVLLSNLLNWISELGVEEITVDRPNYSQRIRKNK
ncbi:phospholipase D-like domain-containing protein [Sporosarcina sp. ITBMC105]